MSIAVATAARIGRKAVLALGIAVLATTAPAQTVAEQDADTPAAGLDLPANLQIFGKANPNIRKPTAIVNDVVITGTDVDQRVAMFTALNNIHPEGDERDRMRLQVLRQLIDETLEIQEAKANKVEITKEDIDTSFARFSRQLDKSPDQMRVWLRQVGSSEASVKRQIEGEIAWNHYLRKGAIIEISDAEIKAILARLEAAKGTNEYHFFEIYVNAGADRANEVFGAEQHMMEQLKQGTPFADLARTYSEASTRAKGGDLGWIHLQMLPDQLAATAQTMEIGQLAGPVELPGGFSILYLADKRQVLAADPRDARLSLKQITITFPPGTTEAQAQSRAGAFATATQTIKGCGDADRISAQFSGDVVPNDTNRIRDLPVLLQNMILPLQVGQATQPFGSPQDGVRVLVLCGRDEPQANSLPSMDEVRDQEEEKRTNLRSQRMLRDLRRDALIEYR